MVTKLLSGKPVSKTVVLTPHPVRVASLGILKQRELERRGERKRENRGERKRENQEEMRCDFSFGFQQQATHWGAVDYPITESRPAGKMACEAGLRKRPREMDKETLPESNRTHSGDPVLPEAHLHSCPSVPETSQYFHQ